jgi:hypothetical protein
MGPVDCGKKVFIPLQPGLSGPGPEYPGNPDIPGKIPEIPLPLSPASRFARNLILDRFGRLYM